MPTLGSLAEQVNAQAYHLFVTLSGTNYDFIAMQDCHLDYGGQELAEPTTGGSLALFSAIDRPSVRGTLLYNSSQWANVDIRDFSSQVKRTNGEKPIVSWVAQLTDQQGSPVTHSFTFTSKTENVSIDKQAEGGAKVSLVLKLLADPTIT